MLQLNGAARSFQQLAGIDIALAGDLKEKLRGVDSLRFGRNQISQKTIAIVATPLLGAPLFYRMLRGKFA